jgi:hypothetical protein
MGEDLSSSYSACNLELRQQHAKYQANQVCREAFVGARGQK